MAFLAGRSLELGSHNVDANHEIDAGAVGAYDLVEYAQYIAGRGCGERTAIGIRLRIWHGRLAHWAFARIRGGCNLFLRRGSTLRLVEADSEWNKRLGSWRL